MINAYLNSVELKLFPDIAIGLTIENFNISDLSNRKIDRTNVINVPKAGNEVAFEFASLPNAPTDFAYNDYDFDLVIDGMFIYENGRAFITGEDSDSYTLQVTNNKNIIDLLKSINLADLYDGDTPSIVTTANWLTLFQGKTNGFKIDLLFDEGYTPAIDTYTHLSAESYISIYIDTILAKIAADYSITFSGNLLTDADFLEMRIPCVASNFKRNSGSIAIYLDDLIIHDSLTAWDLIKNILQLTCSVFKIDGIDLEMQKFNDLDYATPADWSGKLVSSTKKFAIPGIAQKNYIRYTAAEDIDKDYKSALVECNNTNIDYIKDIATMKAKLFPFRDIQSFYTNVSQLPFPVINLPDLDVDIPFAQRPNPTRVAGLKDLIIYVDSDEFLGQPIAVFFVYWYENPPGTWTSPSLGGNLVADADTTVVEYYDPTANYSLIETMLTDPVFYDAELNLNILDINSFDPFRAVKIDELEGVFYVNKIVDFLATAPGTPTKAELIKIS